MVLRLLISICFVFSAFLNAYSAQDNDSIKVPFKDRVALHANTVGYVFVTPNIGMEYSFIQNRYQKVSLFLNGKYNPNSYTKLIRRYLYNIVGVRSEVRWYFRMRKITEGERKLDLQEGFWRKLTMRPHSFLGRENPRLHRAYYFGPYFAYDKYTVKLSKTGYQGYSLGVGVAAGYTIPLYQYKDGSSIDFELGANLGLALSTHDKFIYDADGACYSHAGKRAIHVVPFPIIADARVAFVYRFKSIRNQIVDINIEKIEKSGFIYDLMEKYKENNAKYIASSEISNDSIKRFNEIINAKNREIREINKQASKLANVDSTMLLTELGLYYEYLKIPENIFYKYDEMLPNIDVKSISELKNPYIDNILKAYSGINDELYGNMTVASVATQLLKGYNLFPGKDDLPAIRFIEYLVNVVPNVNNFSVSSHNDVYHSVDSLEKTSVVMLRSAVVMPSTISDGKVRTSIKNFVFGIDSISLKKEIGGGVFSKNIEIEAENLYKRMLLEEMIDQQKLADAENVKAKPEIHEKKSAKKNKKSKSEKQPKQKSKYPKKKKVPM